jgi:hypothetical protein
MLWGSIASYVSCYTYQTVAKIKQDNNDHPDSPQNISQNDIALLDKLPHAKDAGFMSGNRPNCLKGTREDVLNTIISWAHNLEDWRIFWLNGHAV